MEVIVGAGFLIALFVSVGIAIGELFSDSPPLYIDEEEMKYQEWKKKRDKIEQERKFEQRYRKEQKGD
jgi:hypothetical protein